MLKKDSPVIPYFVFLCWPFLAFVSAFLNIRRKWSQYIIILFSGFIGFCFYIKPNGADATYYHDVFINYRENLDVGVLEFIQMVNDKQLGRGDFYDVTLTYIVSRVTSDYRILFGLFGLVFGYFLVNSLKLILEFVDKSNCKISGVVLFLVFCLFFINPPWSIYAVRFYTAAQIFVFGVIGWTLKRDYKYLIVIAFTYFVHFSFVFAILIFFLFLIIGRSPYTILLFLILGFVFKGFDINIFLNELPDYLPKFEMSKVNSYANPEYVKQFLKNQNAEVWFLKYKSELMNYICIIFGFIIVYKKKVNHQVKSLALAGLFYMAFSNVVSLIPSLDRFFVIGQMLLIGATIIFLSIFTNTILQKIFPVFMIIMSLFIVIELRRGLDMVSPWVFLGNPLIIGFTENWTSVYPQ